MFHFKNVTEDVRGQMTALVDPLIIVLGIDAAQAQALQGAFLFPAQARFVDIKRQVRHRLGDLVPLFMADPPFQVGELVGSHDADFVRAEQAQREDQI